MFQRLPRTNSENWYPLNPGKHGYNLLRAGMEFRYLEPYRFMHVRELLNYAHDLPLRHVSSEYANAGR
jgi:hypothetical protein